jgi:predicted double-glycine peptidase
MVAARAPCLAPIKLHLLLDHAVVVVEADLTGVTVLDPLWGPRRIARARFERIWKSEALLAFPAARD